MGELLVLSAIGEDARRWEGLLEGLPRADVYFTPAYAAAYERIGAGRAVAFVLAGDEGVVLHSLLLRSLDGLPGTRDDSRLAGALDAVTPYGYGGPLCSGRPGTPGATGVMDRLLEEFDELFRGACSEAKIVTEFVRFHPLLETHRGFEERMRVIGRGETVWMSLEDDEDGLIAAMTPQGRNKVRRARREGVSVDIEEGEEALDVLCALYGDTIQRLNAASDYEFPREYFRDIAALPGGGSEILVARKGSAPLWAGIFMHRGEFSHYHLSGSDRKDRTPGVNNLALLEAAGRARSRGARVLHLGGGLGGRADSLFAFKSSLSPNRASFRTGERVHDPARYEMLCRARDKSGAPADKDYFPSYRAPTGVPGTPTG